MVRGLNLGVGLMLLVGVHVNLMRDWSVFSFAILTVLALVNFWLAFKEVD